MAQRRTSWEAVVLENLAEDQLVGVEGERVPEHGDGDEVHVAVGALGLVGARSIEVPLRNV